MLSKSLWLSSLGAVALGLFACGGEAGETRGESRPETAAGAPALGAAGSVAIGGSAGAALPSVAGGSAFPVGAAGRPSMPAVTAPQPAGSGAAASAGSGAPAVAGAGAATTAGSGAPAQGMNPSLCPPAPMGSTPEAVAALAAVNNYRVPAGAGCVTMIAEINAAASAHCKYYDMYMEGDMCIASPHMEVMSCAGFTGENPGARMRAAGYMSSGGGEVMAFVNNAQSAVDTWMNSVWHRTPIIDPWTTHLGYGNATRCDTIDFGRGMTPAPADTVVVYPYDGQMNVPVSFNGQYEGPMPPAPPTGWPSSGPISISARGVMLTEHVLTKDGDPTPIEHVWLDSQADIVAADMRRSLTNISFMYANMPFTPNTKYRVKVSGTYMAGAIAKEWVFTTGAAPTWPRR